MAIKAWLVKGSRGQGSFGTDMGHGCGFAWIKSGKEEAGSSRGIAKAMTPNPKDSMDERENGNKAFGDWLNECASIAMESEWCIDPAWRWRELYDSGATPREAVDSLFDAIAETETD